jgi:hypothetical protein
MGLLDYHTAYKKLLAVHLKHSSFLPLDDCIVSLLSMGIFPNAGPNQKLLIIS